MAVAPPFLCHSWRKGFVPPFKVPRSPEFAQLGVGGGEKLFRSLVWQIFVLTHCGYFNVIWNPVAREIKWADH